MAKLSRYSMIALVVVVTLGAVGRLAGQEKANDAPAPKKPQIQLDVVLVEAKPGVIPAFALRFLKRAGRVHIGTMESKKQADEFQRYIQSLRTNGVAKVVAEPRLVTLSGRQASFLSGGEIAIPIPKGPGSVGVQFEEFGTRLDFTPTLLGKGRIRLEVEPTMSSLDYKNAVEIEGTTVPGRKTERTKTKVDLKAGQTFVIHGLTHERTVHTTTRVPVLGDLPVLGRMFKNVAVGSEKREVLMMVTPHLVEPLHSDE